MLNVKDRKLSDGYAWLVVVGGLFLQFLGCGTMYHFGIMLIALSADSSGIDANLSMMSFVGSFQVFCLYFTGAFAGRLVKFIGCRIISIIGSVMCAVGFFASAFSPNIFVMYITYGLINGVGCGFLYLSSLVAVQQNFDKNRTLASAVCALGIGVGMLGFPFITQKLLAAYHWRTTLKIEAVMMLTGVLAGILLFPPPPDAEIENKTEYTELEQRKERARKVTICQEDYPL